MSNRNQRAPMQSSLRTRPQRSAAPPRPVAPTRGPSRAAVQRPGASRNLAAGLPIDPHRLIAAVALAMLMLLALAGPTSTAAPNSAALLTPNIDGSDAIPAATSGSDVAQAVFRYQSVIERNQAAVPTTPDSLNDVLRYEPDSVRVRKVLFGQMIASTSGNLDMTMLQSGFFSNITPEEYVDIESAYEGLLGSQARATRGLNGLAVMRLIRSLYETGTRRAELEREALGGFQSAIQEDSEGTTWQFTYNYALANIVTGNYAMAYDAMRGISSRADEDNNKLTGFWMGLALLRSGDPGQAIVEFNSVINTPIPAGGNEAFRALYDQAKTLAREALADAQSANRQPEAAYNTYYNTLLLGNTDDIGLYTKWLRLGLQQRAYERLLADMSNLANSTGFGREARIHHDRARLLTFLGRTSEAEAEYARAMQIAGEDPSLLISYGQALEARGDHNAALPRAEAAISALGKDPGTADLSSVVAAAVATNTSGIDAFNAQQLLDATLLRARAWGGLGQPANVENIASGIAQQAGSLPPGQAALLHLYAGMAAEAGGARDKAVSSYQAAWDIFKGLPAGTSGRVGALAGLARTTALGGDAAAGVKALADNGYDPASPPNTVTTNPDAPALLYQGALLMEQAGMRSEAANAYRVAALAGNIQDAASLSGVGRPFWNANGTSAPANAVLAAADAGRQAGDAEQRIAALRYREAFSLDPSLAASRNNLGVLYAERGNNDRAGFYLRSGGFVSPSYALGQQNAAAIEYKRGIANFFNAEAAQAAAIKAEGPQTLNWGYSVRADERGPLPATAAPPSDFLSRLPALLILLLLLAHTLVGNDRLTNRMGLLPTRGVLGMLASRVDAAVRGFAPRLMEPRSDRGALLATIGIPTLIGTLGLAWAAGRGSLEVALVFIPVALLSALLAFGANELAQYATARRGRGATVHHIWPLGVLLGILSMPFNFVYGWQAITRVQPAGGAESDGAATRRSVVGRRPRTEEDLDLAYEAQAEAAAELDPTEVTARVGTPVGPVAASPRLLGLSPAARILFAGLAANLVLGLIFGLVYWLTAWPSMRLAMFASMLVLAFTAVSEPPADGWTLYRRNAPLWLALFIFAAAIVTLLAAGLI